MPKSGLRQISLLVVFALVSTGLVVHADCPDADLTDDCRVDFADLFAFGLQWLDIPGGTANFHGVGGVDMDDFVRLAAEWGVVGIPPVTLVINEFMAQNTSTITNKTAAPPLTNCIFGSSDGEEAQAKTLAVRQASRMLLRLSPGSYSVYRCRRPGFS